MEPLQGTVSNGEVSVGIDGGKPRKCYTVCIAMLAMLPVVGMPLACGASQVRQTQVADESDQSEDTTAEDHYRMCKGRAGFSNAFAPMAGQQPMPDDCAQVAQLEYAQQAHREDVRREKEARRAELEVRRAELESQQQAEAKREWQAVQANNRQIRRNPKAPERGATLEESRALCEQQSGFLAVRRSTIGTHAACQVGSVPIFEALIRKDESGISSLKIYYEQGDIGELRRRAEEKLGPPSDSGVSDGFRFWAWYGDGLITRVSAYSAGVSFSLEELR